MKWYWCVQGSPPAFGWCEMSGVTQVESKGHVDKIITAYLGGNIEAGLLLVLLLRIRTLAGGGGGAAAAVS